MKINKILSVFISCTFLFGAIPFNSMYNSGYSFTASAATYSLEQIRYSSDAFNYYANEMKKDLFGSDNIYSDVIGYNGEIYTTRFDNHFKTALAVLNDGNINSDVLATSLYYADRNGGNYSENIMDGVMIICSMFSLEYENSVKIDFAKYMFDKEEAAFYNKVTNAGFDAMRTKDMSNMWRIGDDYFINHIGTYTYDNCDNSIIDLYLSGTLSYTIGAEADNRYGGGRISLANFEYYLNDTILAKINDSTTNSNFKIGDVNEDGTINAVDASIVLSAYALTATGNTPDLNERQLAAADVNGDERVDAIDASLILGYYAYTATGGQNSLDTYLDK